MTSILTNSSATAALQTLRTISSSLGDTQNQVSTGMRVATASDDAAYWSIATTMRSDNMAFSAVQDAIGLSAAVLDTTYAAVSSSIDVMSSIKARLVAATEEGLDRTKINEELTQFKDQLRSTLESASFSGQNWLVWNTGDDSLDKQIVNSFIRSPDGGVQIGTISYPINTPPPRTDTNVQYFVDNGGSGEYGILSSEAFSVEIGSAKNYVLLRGATAPDTAIDLSIDNLTTPEELGDMLGTVEAMTVQMASVASVLGSFTMRLEKQGEFLERLTDSIDSGIGRLVDADMNEASTRLKALQTQEQLATQSLQIANTNPENILSLFR